MLSDKDLNWLVPNPCLYSQAFTGRAKRHPQCLHSLSEDHGAAGCPYNPNPPIMGWFRGTPPLQLGPATGQLSPRPNPSPKNEHQSEGLLQLQWQLLSVHQMPLLTLHAALHCPDRQTVLVGQGGLSGTASLYSTGWPRGPYVEPPPYIAQVDAGSAWDCVFIYY